MCVMKENEAPQEPAANEALGQLTGRRAEAKPVQVRASESSTRTPYPTFRTSRDAFSGILPTSNAFLLNDLRQS